MSATAGAALSYFAADCLISRAAEEAGYRITRRSEIAIDPDLLPDRYYRETPDYTLIRKHLNDGVEIPGATLITDVQYVLAREGGR